MLTVQAFTESTLGTKHHAGHQGDTQQSLALRWGSACGWGGARRRHNSLTVICRPLSENSSHSSVLSSLLIRSDVLELVGLALMINA